MYWLIPSLPEIVPNFYEKCFEIKKVLNKEYSKDDLVSEIYDDKMFKEKTMNEIK